MPTNSHGESYHFTIGLLSALCLCLAAGLLPVMQARAGDRDGHPVVQVARASQTGVASVSGEVLVRLRAGVSMSSTSALASSLGSAKSRDLGVRAILPEGERILLFKSSERTGDALVKTALLNPNVIAASLNYRRHADSVTPNDPRFSELWGLNNTGQTGGTADADIDAPEAWEHRPRALRRRGRRHRHGRRLHHPDLAANMWHNPGEIAGNGIDDDGNG